MSATDALCSLSAAQSMMMLGEEVLSRRCCAVSAAEYSGTAYHVVVSVSGLGKSDRRRPLTHLVRADPSYSASQPAAVSRPSDGFHTVTSFPANSETETQMH
jgi:hypothetical protein